MIGLSRAVKGKVTNRLEYMLTNASKRSAALGLLKKKLKKPAASVAGGNAAVSASGPMLDGKKKRGY